MSTPKLSMKGFTLSTKPASVTKSSLRQETTSKLGKRSRVLLDQDDEDESIFNDEAAHEVVNGFGDTGALKSKQTRIAEPLIIQRLANRDWKSEVRSRNRREAGRNLLPPEAQAAREATAKDKCSEGSEPDTTETINTESDRITWGLSVVRRSNDGEQGFTKPSVQNYGSQKEEGKDANTSDRVGPELLNEPPTKQAIEDEEALEALLGVQASKRGVNLIIPTQEAEVYYHDTAPLTEEASYRRAIRLAPDVSTLEDYEKVPVEDFGAALLRGMGWNGEKISGPKDVKRRQNLLGLGAKHLKDAEELGAWVQKSDVKRLNNKGSQTSANRERRPRANEYKREKDMREEQRRERHGNGYRSGPYRDNRDNNREIDFKR